MSIRYKELNLIIVDRQIELFGRERVRQALLNSGLEPGSGDSLVPDNSEDSERGCRRLLLAFGRHLGFMSMTASKSALLKYCMENDLPIEHYFRSLISSDS